MVRALLHRACASQGVGYSATVKEAVHSFFQRAYGVGPLPTGAAVKPWSGLDANLDKSLVRRFAHHSHTCMYTATTPPMKPPPASLGGPPPHA
jgi:hypothetical protein